MNVLKSSIGRSLAAAAVAAVLAPLSSDALGAEGRDRPPRPDEVRRGDADGPREAERPDRDAPESRREMPQPERAEAEHRRHHSPEAEALRRQIEVMELAIKALMEAEKRGAAELVERAIHARRMSLEGRRDDEAHEIRERAPNHEQLADVLAMAAGIWKEFKDGEKAEAVGRLAREYAAHDRPRQGVPFERPRGPLGESRHREGMDGREHREMVERRLVHLRAAVENLRAAGLHEHAERLMREGERLMRGAGEEAGHRSGWRPEHRDRPPEHREHPMEHQQQLEGVVRELNGQVEQLRRELEEMRHHMERMHDRLEDEDDD